MLTLLAIGIPGWHELLLFAGAALVLNATPGVDLLLTVSRTLQGGARAGAAAAAGIGAGCLVHAVAAALGLAALLAVSAAAFTAVKWLGAAYLLWLAAQMLREAWRGGVPARADAPAAAPRTAWAEFRTGLLTNVLNPKVALFFVAFLPQFIAPAATHKGLAMLVLGGWFAAQGTLFLWVVVAVVARLRALPAAPAAGRWLRVAGAMLFGVLAWRLLGARAPAA